MQAGVSESTRGFESTSERFDQRLLDDIRLSIDLSYRENKHLFKRALIGLLKTAPQIFKNEDLTNLNNEKMEIIVNKVIDGKCCVVFGAVCGVCDVWCL